MDTDIKTIATTALSLWIKTGILTMDEFTEAMKISNDELVKLLNKKMNNIDFGSLQSKIEECLLTEKADK